MKLKSLLLFILFVSFNLHAQNKSANYQISGQVIEATTGKDIPYVTVTIQNDSAKIIKKISSDASGKFTFTVAEKKTYSLIFTSIGYSEVTKKIDVTDTKTDLSKIKMDEGIALKEVSVSVQRPLVKVDADKITYNVESDPDSHTSNALDMLRKVPLVTVNSEDEVTLNGQSNFKVLINGKSSSMMSNNFKDIIKTIPANSIKDIEVITNPSSKYDAEGVGGIINIITTKKSIAGYNGSVTAGADSRGGLNGSLYLAAKINKFGFSVRYSDSEYKNAPNSNTSERKNYLSDTYRTTNSTGSSKSSGNSSNFSGELSYEIDSLNLISSSFWGYGYTARNNSQGITNTLDINNVRSQYYESLSNGKYTYNTLSGNIDYQKTYKKPDKTFTLSYKLDNSPNTSNYETDVINTLNYSPYAQRSVRDALSREQTLQVDYYDPLSANHQLECGVKAIYRQNDSNSDTYRLNTTTNLWEYSQTKSNDLDYNQYILGAYAGYVFKLKTLTVKGGLRAEYTWNNATSKSDSVIKFSNKLQNVVPYVTFNYQVKPGRTLRASYTQRLYRPGIYYLNPYVDTSTPQYISYGNPHLKSEVSHSFELGYSTFTQKLNLSLTGRGSFTNNSIESISTVNANDVRTTTYENIGTNMNVGLNLYCSYRPNEKFNIYCNGNGSYIKMEANNGTTLSNKGYMYYGSFGARAVLWKDNSISINGNVSSPSIMLQGKSSVYFYNGVSISQMFLNKKLTLSLSVTNPFKRFMTQSYSMTDQNSIQNYEYKYETRNARFSLSYNFGKTNMEVKKARRGISNDDVKSGGSSN
ncbi:TonB-dependent receptor [Paludibacter propionicigenes WB4]|uniref:TonB-dependent receptor n=1 Tax=Paludibacter propionicigenes (strain DSM 17365 / JCM 13257 / WB4) TaxID=694427 RepID=E4T5C5_PALPW|nr:TonB-dependent receptor [Paludibacter propionicigenes]ADQ79919.1 TonB-dependent receptor [Paludibacter propionicigenes WB4]